MTALCSPGTAASQNISGTQRQSGGILIFLSFTGINILTNQYQKVTFFSPLWASVTQAEDRKRGKGKTGRFIFLFRERGMREQEGRGPEEVERTEKVSCGQRTRKLGKSKQLRQQPAAGG